MSTMNLILYIYFISVIVKIDVYTDIFETNIFYNYDLCMNIIIYLKYYILLCISSYSQKLSKLYWFYNILCIIRLYERK